MKDADVRYSRPRTVRRKQSRLQIPRCSYGCANWIGGVPPNEIVAAISDRLKAAKGEDRYELALQLEHFLLIAKRHEEVLELLDKLMVEFPDDERLPMRKASVHLYFSGNFEEALRSIDIALELAYRTGFFRREALGVKARILLKLGRGDELTRVLEQIMAMEMIKGVPDVGRERDFIDRAPPGMISENVLVRYNKFRPKQSGDSTADEPPEWESPEWE